MRIAHATDIHWQVRPTLADLPGKRFLGSLNLYVRGRHTHFTEAVQAALVAHLVELEPDAVFITGDLTAQALDTEFLKARTALGPVLERFPTLIIPGNHDVYTQGSVRTQRIQRHFGDWMGLAGGPVGRLDIGNVTLLGLDSNRPHPISASGVIPEPQLAGLADLLDSDELAGRDVILGLHHPPADRHGELYLKRGHGLINAQALADLLDGTAHKPVAILCGHVHHGFRSGLKLPSGGQIEVLDCGSSGYAYLPDHGRAACMGVYDVTDGQLTVERYQFDGTRFAPEPGGAYATGR